jgi:uncharacterized membrane protein YphA (DoxX/SURF4 family)
MDVLLWILAGVLAALFLAAGLMKVTQPREALLPRLAWVEDFPQPVVRLIGALEVLGAIGLVLPAAVGIAPVLVPVAATGLAVTMVGAAVVHLRRHESPMVAVNLVLLALLLVVAVLRFGVSAF